MLNGHASQRILRREGDFRVRGGKGWGSCMFISFQAKEIAIAMTRGSYRVMEKTVGGLFFFPTIVNLGIIVCFFKSFRLLLLLVYIK